MADVLTALGDVSVQNAFAAPVMGRIGKLRNEADIAATAKQFESMFMAQMLQPMFEGLEANSLFGGGHGEEMMRGFLVQEYGKAVVQGSNSRLSDALKSDIIRLQSKANATGESL